MSMLERFSDIIKANINDLLDKCEDPAKMIDQYLRDLTENLAEVKRETAAVMAEETRTKRMVEENAAEIRKYEDLAKKHCWQETRAMPVCSSARSRLSAKKRRSWQ